jgi:hypothetical protein
MSRKHKHNIKTKTCITPPPPRSTPCNFHVSLSALTLHVTLTLQTFEAQQQLYDLIVVATFMFSKSLTFLATDPFFVIALQTFEAQQQHYDLPHSAAAALNTVDDAAAVNELIRRHSGDAAIGK